MIFLEEICREIEEKTSKLDVFQPNVPCMNMKKTISFQIQISQKTLKDLQTKNYLCLDLEIQASNLHKLGANC